MRPKTLKIAYWASTGLFALLLVMDGVAGILQEETGRQVLLHLGYPVYAMTIMGAAKLAAAVAILQWRYRTVKEWAFAGFAFTCYGAFFSRLTVGDSGIDLLFPIIFFLLMLVPYYFWKRAEAAGLLAERKAMAAA